MTPADGPYRYALEDVARRVGVADRVTISTGNRRELRAEYLAADAVIFPSEWDEPFGLVPVEAMACAVPVLGTGTGGSGEFLIDGRTSLRFRPGDPKSLVQALERLAAAPELRARLVDDGIRLAEELSIGKLTTYLEEWHLDAISGFPRGQPRPRDVRMYK
jgi:glycosyltransferase involved in cell wall biosynthesis